MSVHHYNPRMVMSGSFVHEFEYKDHGHCPRVHEVHLWALQVRDFRHVDQTLDY
jgi:hypothetical protein